MKARLIVAAFCGLFLFVIATPFTMQPYVQASSFESEPGVRASSAQKVASCQAILARAMDTLQSACNDLGRNKACYGHDLVKAELRTDDVRFSALGDIVPIQAVKKITTSALDLQRGTWGLSLLKLQANLPDTLPGQNVTFLVYGDISVENLSGNMQSFYFTSGLGDLKCNETPNSGILIKSPNHTQVTFTANGVQITMASTVLLRAEKNRAMNVQLIEGHANVRTNAGVEALLAGQYVSIPLGGNSGMEAQGKPSTPQAAPPDPVLAPVIHSAENISQSNSPSVLPSATSQIPAKVTNPPGAATIQATSQNTPIPVTATMTVAPPEETPIQAFIVVPTNTTAPAIPTEVPPTIAPPIPTQVPPAPTVVQPTVAEVLPTVAAPPPTNNPAPTNQSAPTNQPPAGGSGSQTQASSSSSQSAPANPPTADPGQGQPQTTPGS